MVLCRDFRDIPSVLEKLGFSMFLKLDVGEGGADPAVPAIYVRRGDKTHLRRTGHSKLLERSTATIILVVGVTLPLVESSSGN